MVILLNRGLKYIYVGRAYILIDMFKIVILFTF